MVTAEEVKRLREKSGAGMMDCKRALTECGGDAEKALVFLREKGLAAALKKADRVASEGIVETYVHGQGRIGVMLELNCETDFVARTEPFKALAHDLALQVAAAKPQWTRREDVPPEVVERERSILAAQLQNDPKNAGKPPAIVEKIVTGRLDKFFEEACLEEQPFIRDPDVRIRELIQQATAQLGEKIAVRRFVRFEMGETQA